MGYDLKRWEFSALLLESILLAAAIMGSLMWLGMRAAATSRVSAYLLMALAFAAGGLCLLPVLIAEARNTHGNASSIGRRVAWIVLAALIGAGAWYFLR